jgi:hypothetical protein
MSTAVRSKEIIVEAKNRVGLLSEIAGKLADAKINMQSLCCYCMEGQASFMFVVDKHAAAKICLKKAGYKVSEQQVLKVEISNKPGELAKAAAKISAVGVDMDYAYATVTGRTATVVVKTRDDAKALKALKK